METRIFECRQLEHAFLERWPLRAIEAMSLDDFVDTNDRDTFCYWVERLTIRLGSIKGHPSIKFGIYKRNHARKIPRNYDSDNAYSWAKGLHAATRQDAFEIVKAQVVQTIKAATRGEFHLIDNIMLNHLFKWKIAALYSQEGLVPIFAKESIIAIAEIKGLPNLPHRPFSKIYAFLIAQKPVDQNIYQYALNLLNLLRKDTQRAFYILGSKYDGTLDMLPSMLEAGVVSTGFCSQHDLQSFYRNDEKTITNELLRLREPKASINALNYFLQLKPGDIIAVKSSGNPRAGNAFLEIVAYAMVVERNGCVYYYEGQNFGHCINVEWIETDLEIDFGLGGYGRTIQPISEPELITLLFGEYADFTIVNRKIKRRRRRAAGGHRNTNAQNRKGSKPYVANMKHNEIQQQFIDRLIDQHGVTCVFVEEDFVDVKLVLDDRIILYEIKPFACAEDCIREGLGQLLAYAHRIRGNNPIEIKIVGPCRRDHSEARLISYIRAQLNIDFDYLYFNPI